MSARYDLHLHSRHSDGFETIEELLQLAVRSGIQGVSITDHDTTAHVRPSMETAIAMKVPAITGIEISACDPDSNRKIHIMGYGFHTEANAINSLCEPLLERRRRNTERQIHAISRAGYKISVDEVRVEAGGSACLYKQHVMAVLMKKGYCDGIYAPLYRELFKGSGIAVGDIEYVHWRDAVEAVTADGGIAVLAHPGQQDSLDLVPTMVLHGLGGIEINHPDNNTQVKGLIHDLIERYGLIATGGSDYHGAFGSSSELGNCYAPDTFLQAWNEIKPNTPFAT